MFNINFIHGKGGRSPTANTDIKAVAIQMNCVCIFARYCGTSVEFIKKIFFKVSPAFIVEHEIHLCVSTESSKQDLT